ncbi:sugar O-acetyltransferase [Parascardovia denticolens]|nr:sugar O-acetyltransferase [Parascardovia denticolens]
MTTDVAVPSTPDSPDFLGLLDFSGLPESTQEQEKMLAGRIYDPADPRLVALRVRSHNLSREYNGLDETDPRRQRILQGWLDLQGENVFLQGPVQFDYGCFTSIGENSYANFNFTCLDCCPMTIGRNVFIGPNVSLLTPVHPLRFQDRNLYRNARGQMTDHEYAKPIVISDNCWIAGNVTVCGGVTIGEGCVIGAGSVVTRDIPSGMVAFGDPCRPIRPITEEDGMSDLFEAE